MSDKYVVMYEVDTGEYAYATAENPFTYDSKKLIFDTKDQAEIHAKNYATSFVIKQSEIRPFDKTERARAKIREEINKGL